MTPIVFYSVKKHTLSLPQYQRICRQRGPHCFLGNASVIRQIANATGASREGSPQRCDGGYHFGQDGRNTILQRPESAGISIRPASNVRFVTKSPVAGPDLTAHKLCRQRAEHPPEPPCFALPFRSTVSS